MERGTPERREDERQVFRPWGWLRWTVVGAAVFWVLVFFLLVGLGGAPDQAFASTAFFIVFFTALCVFYNNVRIEVMGDLLVVRGVTSFQTVAFEEITGVEVKPGLMQTSYQVLARRGPVLFSNFIAGHRRLLALIEERTREAKLGRL